MVIKRLNISKRVMRIFMTTLDRKRISRSKVMKINIRRTNCMEYLVCVLLPRAKNPASIGESLVLYHIREVRP